MPADGEYAAAHTPERSAASTLRILVVCTANVCRSPVAEHLLQRHLDEQAIRGVVRSGGTYGGRNLVHRHTATAAASVGVDLGQHVSRPVTPQLLAIDGADLVVTMTREHLRHVVAVEPDAWPRAFTLKELVRLSSGVAVPADAVPTPPVAAWCLAVADGRTAASMVGDDPSDDVLDPHGGPLSGHAAMVEEVDHLTRLLARQLAAALH